jgi:hypothetical protein
MMRILQASQVDEWQSVLDRSVQHDFYFLPGYHALAEQRGEGKALLFVYEHGDYMIALPLLLRSLAGIVELGQEADGWQDATSVYGYAGPLASHEEVPGSVLHGFANAVKDALLERHVISVFSRLHPLIRQHHLLAGLGDCQPCGQTVSIDLTLSPDQQRAQYRGTLKTRLNKFRSIGVTCEPDREKRHLAEFISIYQQTMRRVNAQDSYFFEPEYFTRLAETLGERLQLFTVKWGNEVMAAGLFTVCEGIVQYHLGGSSDAFLKLSPMTLLLDGVRLWANEQSARIFHLGGGVGARQDSLFQFKTGFSDCRHDFATWRWVVAPDHYQRLHETRQRWNRERALEPAAASFFPTYRCPAVPRTSGSETLITAAGWLLAATDLSL